MEKLKRADKPRLTVDQLAKEQHEGFIKSAKELPSEAFDVLKSTGHAILTVVKFIWEKVFSLRVRSHHKPPSEPPI